MNRVIEKIGTLVFLMVCVVSWSCAQPAELWVEFEPEPALDKGKEIVLISGDEEYRSEEYLPMLAQILTAHHGFTTRVLFAIDPKTQKVDPTYTQNIPGMDFLETADLVIIATRFRELPDAQMKYFDDYLNAGKPVIGLRTATHAFNFPTESKSSYKKYSYNSTEENWEGGFGQKILGETWVSHHGDHGSEGTRAVVNGLLADHPVLNGVSDIWGPTDVYTVKHLSKNAKVLLWGQPTLGMTEESPTSWKKSLMPIAWTQTYKADSGREGKVFTTTMGSAIDFESEDLRRLIVNACYWALGLDSSEKAKADIVGEYKPTAFGFGTFRKDKSPQDFVRF